MKKHLYGALILAVLLLAPAPLVFTVTPAFAASGKASFVVKDSDWHVENEGKLSDAPTPNGSQETSSGWIYWLYADPGVSDEAKGAERGMYFYADKTKKYSFMPFGSANVNGVHFNGDGSMFIVESVPEGETQNITLELFTFADMASRFKTQKAAIPPQWVDAGRFAYSRFEPGTKRGKPADYPDEWMSLAMYDTVSKEESVLKAATDTSDFTLMGVGDDGVLVVWEEYVESPKDWADPDKADMREVTVEIPPAG